jgi:hypothetical protein
MPPEPTGPRLLSGESSDEPNIGRSAMTGAVLGFVVATVAVTVLGILGGIGAGASLGLGIFVGMWGGAGFGFMMGATVPYARHLDAHRMRSASQEQTRHDLTTR